MKIVALRWIALVGILGVAAPTTFGCKKETPASKDDDKGDKKKSKGDDDDDDKGSKSSKKSKKGGDDDEAATGGKYKSGDMLAHAPKKCDAGYMYMNVGALLKSDAVASNAGALQDKLTDSMKGSKDSKKVAKVLKAMKKAGFDYSRDIKEFAVCAPSDWNAPVVLAGGNFGDGFLKKMSKAIESVDEEDDVEEVKESDGVSYVKMKKKGVLAQVSDNVLAAGDDKDAVFALKKKGSAPDDWDVGKGRILALKVVDKKKKDINVDATITESGDDYDFKVSMEFGGAQGEKFKENPAAIQTEFEKQRDMIAAKIRKTPFKALADDIEKTKIKVDGSKFSFSVKVPSAHLAQAIKAASESSGDDLQGIFK